MITVAKALPQSLMMTEMAIPMCVLSNKPHEYTAPICEALLSRWPIVRVRGCSAIETRKPDPTVALELAKEMARDPSTVYLVGDSPVDIAAAHNAGMISVAVTWGYGDCTALDLAHPAFSIDQPKKLVNVFNTVSWGKR